MFLSQFTWRLITLSHNTSQYPSGTGETLSRISSLQAKLSMLDQNRDSVYPSMNDLKRLQCAAVVGTQLCQGAASSIFTIQLYSSCDWRIDVVVVQSMLVTAVFWASLEYVRGPPFCCWPSTITFFCSEYFHQDARASSTAPDALKPRFLSNPVCSCGCYWSVKNINKTYYKILFFVRIAFVPIQAYFLV